MMCRSLYSFIFIILSLIILGCEQDPYPQKDQYTKEDAPKRKPIKKPISVSFPQKMEFIEGRMTAYDMKFTIPKGEKAIVRIEGLNQLKNRQGVPVSQKDVYDHKEGQFIYSPSFEMGNDASDPLVTTRVYPLKIFIALESDTTNMRTENIMVVVKDKPRRFEFRSKNVASVTEGKTLRHEIKIYSQDFASKSSPGYKGGPFRIVAENLPVGAKIYLKNPQKDLETYILEYSPDFLQTKISNRSDNCTFCRKHEVSLTVKNPRNQEASQKLVININDKRVAPLIANPKTITQGLESSFQIQAIDLNGETNPRFTLLNKGDFQEGKLTTSQAEIKENNTTVFNINWKNIPIGYNGKSKVFRFEVCNLDRYENYNICRKDSLKLYIKKEDQKQPIIERFDWDIGEIKYFSYGKTEFFKLEVRSGDNGSKNVDVDIYPEEMREFVVYQKAYDRLRINFRKPGMHQFTVVATSQYKLQSSESFVVEAFAEDRSKALYLVNDARVKELGYFKKVFPNLGIYNPIYQKLTKKDLAHRDTLVIGTSQLDSREKEDFIMSLVDQMETVVVATPFVDNLPQKLIDLFETDYNIKFYGRLKEIDGAPELNSLKISTAPNIGFNRPYGFPKNFVELSGNSSQYSDSPLIFDVGIENRFNCKTFLELKGKNRRGPLYGSGVACRKGRKGKFILTGFEWADLKVPDEERDGDIPYQWLRRLISYDIDDLLRDIN